MKLIQLSNFMFDLDDFSYVAVEYGCVKLGLKNGHITYLDIDGESPQVVYGKIVAIIRHETQGPTESDNCVNLSSLINVEER